MSNAAWLAIALVIVVVAVGGYSVALTIRRRRLTDRLRRASARKH